MRWHTISPLLKVPFILLNIVCGNISSSSPTPPPKADERKRYTDDKNGGTPSRWPSWYTPLRRTVMHIIDICEIYLILSAYYPALQSSLLTTFIMPQNSPSTPFTPGSLKIGTTSTFVLGSILIYIGAFIRVWCFNTLGRHFTFHLAILNGHKLITTGPYKYVRHPSYMGTVIFHIGMVFSQVGNGSWLGEYITCPSDVTIFEMDKCGPLRRFVGFLWVGCSMTTVVLLLGRMRTEDEVLKKEFGGVWEKWAKKTKYQLIPGLM